MNKPVAWIDTFGDIEKFNHSNNKDWIPLYTHPTPTKVKFASDSCESGWIYLENAYPAELTDEEINELANKYLYVLNDVPYADDIKDFAKAILRKAQEK